jgi:hypothetical protein
LLYSCEKRVGCNYSKYQVILSFLKVKNYYWRLLKINNH